ncbi:T9SS C-terminal target domain-containing protein, partial [bacterium]
MKKLLKSSLLIASFLPLAAQAQTTVNVTDASINAGDKVKWTANNTYIIKEMVFVESGAELYIEAGTVVKAELGSGNA